MFFFNGIINIFKFSVKLFVVDLFGGILNIFNTFISLIIKGFTMAYKSLISFIVNPASGILTLIGHIFGTLIGGIESFIRYLYRIGVNIIYNPISSILKIPFHIWELIVKMLNNIATVFLMLASSLNDVGSDIYYFLKLLYNFLMDMMNFNVAVGHSTGAVASAATSSTVVTPTIPAQKHT
jgi:hypothetical protein